MKLFSQTLGHGPDLVMVHGWGLHGDALLGLAEALSDRFRITLIDLPGHGRSPMAEQMSTLNDWADAVAAVAPRHSVYLGWSLGGMVCSTLALRHPHRVSQLILLTSSPRFVRGTDWPYAVEDAMLARFAQELSSDFRGTINRFIALQAKGDDHAREAIRALKARVFAHGDPQPQALMAGLNILRNTDLRTRLHQIQCPVLAISGQHDLLMPPGGVQAMAEFLPQLRIEVIKGAGHAPFISHAEQCTQIIRTFLHG